VWAALRRSPETRDTRALLGIESGVVSVSDCDTEEMLKIAEVAVAVPGVRDVRYRPHEPLN
jgi:hypothetical protein